MMTDDPDDTDDLRRWREDGKAPAGSCPYCASRISMVERDGFFRARCSHRGCGATGPKMRSITRAADLFCCPPRAARLLRELLHRVDELERGMGQMRLIAGLPLPPEVSAKVAEADRLRKLFDDAGEGQYNVLNLVESYQRNSMEADERLRAVRKLLEENGCDCPCDHHPDERGPDCEVCLACRIGEAVGK